MKKNYNDDFYAWVTHNAALLRAGRLSEIDVENLAEEIECMGKSEKRDLVSRLSVLIAHLLKWKVQSMRRSKSWTLTIRNQRIELNDLLQESPSLKKELKAKFDHVYEKAILMTAEQTGIDEEEFPKVAPFTLDDCLNASYLPA